METGKLGNRETGKSVNWETGKSGNRETGKSGNRETGHQSTNLPVYQSTNILKGLEEEREKKPELAETIVLHHALLLAQADAQVPLLRLEMEL